MLVNGGMADLGATPRFGSVSAPRPSTFNPFASGGAPPPPPPPPATASSAADPLGIRAAIQSTQIRVAPRPTSALWAAAKDALRVTTETYGTAPQQPAKPSPQSTQQVQQAAQYAPVQQALTYAGGPAGQPYSGGTAPGGGGAPDASGNAPDAGEQPPGIMDRFMAMSTGGKLLVGGAVVGGVFVVYKLFKGKGGGAAAAPKSG